MLIAFFVNGICCILYKVNGSESFPANININDSIEFNVTLNEMNLNQKLTSQNNICLKVLYSLL